MMVNKSKKQYEDDDGRVICDMNVEGMRRRNYPKEVISTLQKAYKVVYRQGLTVQKAIEELESWPQVEQLSWFIDSIKNSQRGITR